MLSTPPCSEANSFSIRSVALCVSEPGISNSSLSEPPTVATSTISTTMIPTHVRTTATGGRRTRVPTGEPPVDSRSCAASRSGPPGTRASWCAHGVFPSSKSFRFWGRVVSRNSSVPEPRLWPRPGVLPPATQDSTSARVPACGPRKLSPMFVSFEGVDGSGKSTQAERLAAHLRAAGREVVAHARARRDARSARRSGSCSCDGQDDGALGRGSAVRRRARGARRRGDRAGARPRRVGRVRPVRRLLARLPGDRAGTRASTRCSS